MQTELRTLGPLDSHPWQRKAGSGPMGGVGSLSGNSRDGGWGGPRALLGDAGVNRPALVARSALWGFKCFADSRVYN